MKITIDGHAIQVEGRRTLIEIARQNDIFIPSLCDHPDLKPFTGCRLCLVDIKGRKDFAPSCGTYPQEGMEVTTVTPDLQELRRNILELILSEHPYACLICAEKPSCEDTKATIRKVGEVTGCVLCPQNGRCDLQKVVESLKVERVGYPALYRNLDVRKEDPFFDRDANTCILCGKCIRVCEEVRGASVLSFAFRGSDTVVGTALDRSLLESGCQFCGACVDICPTAALVERAVRPQALPERPASLVCPFCSQGCEIEAGVGKGGILFTRPALSGAVNRGQACVRGRFLVRDTLGSATRIREPWIRRDGILVPAGWEEALDMTAARLKEYEGHRTGIGLGRQIPLEDGYLLFKFAKEAAKTGRVFASAGTSVWAHLGRLMEGTGASLPMRSKLADISNAEAILVFGAALPAAHPMAWLRAVEAVGRGAGLIIVGPASPAMLRHATLALEARPGEEGLVAAALSREILGQGRKPEDIPGFEDFRNATIAGSPAMRAGRKGGLLNKDVVKAAELLAKGRFSVILLDQDTVRGPGGTHVLSSIWNLGILSGARLVPLGSASNDRGIFEIEQWFGPRESDGSYDSLRKSLANRELDALYLAGTIFNPGPDRPELLVCQDTHWSPAAEAADIVLPAAAFAETDGTLINTEGRIQLSRACLVPPGSAKPDRQIVAALASRMGVAGFEFEGAAGILEEIGARIPALRNVGAVGNSPPPEVFTGEEIPAKPKFIPTEPPPAPPAREPGRPHLLSIRVSGDIYRSFDMAGEIRGLARLRRPGQVFLNPVDLAKIGAEEGEMVEIISPLGKLEGGALISKGLPEGTAEMILAGSEPAGWTFISQGIIRVDIRRKR